MEEVKGYCSDSCREEEEGAEAIIAITGSSSSSSRSRLQLQTSQQKEEEDAAVGNLNRMNEEEEEVDLMELRLGGGGRNSKGISEEGIGIGSCLKDEEEEEAGEVEVVVEKEHMFDKVVTPSDVGKLNRLVIPKQHAEKYFPLDSSSNEKGLLLNFEDRNGKMWRFRYSYWNSSQSYVMTKGWSRFVKEKKLDAGDIVSFHRGRAELYRHRLYIDWRPRAHHSQYLIPQYHPPPFYLHPSSSLYSPQYSHLPNPTQYYNTNFYNNTTTTTTLHQQQQQYHHPTADHLVNNNMNNPLYYLASSPITPPSTATGDHQHLQGLVGQGQQQQQQQLDRRNVNVPMNMIIDSVPVAHHHRGGSIMTPTNSGKRLRLFGVNMECDSSSTPPHVAMPNHPLSPSSTTTTTTSVLFDLDPSNSQYHRH